MRRRLGVFVAAAALATAAALGTGSTAAVAHPPPAGGWILIGVYGSYASCLAGAQANAPVHGAGFCERHGSLWYLWAH